MELGMVVLVWYGGIGRMFIRPYVNICVEKLRGNAGVFVGVWKITTPPVHHFQCIGE
jgi:hypothetical protein